MSAANRRAPRLGTLSRHFFQSFFRLSFLDDAGEESFKRAIIWGLSAVVAFGLFLPRFYMGKYSELSRYSVDVVQLMVAADQLLTLCLPMFVTTLVMALVCHSIFPDEVDFRTLMALPLARRTIFGAKFAALFLFAAIFTIGANIGLNMPLSLVTSGRGIDGSYVTRVLGQLIAGVLASSFTVILVVAIEGFLTVAVPRAWLRSVSVAVQTGLVATLVLSLPLLAHIPETWQTIGQQPDWLLLVPPAWFLGVSRWLAGGGEPYFVRLALSALIGTAVVTSVAVACALILYRRFDQSVLRPASGRPPLWWNVSLEWPFHGVPARNAVRDFTSATIRRSGLHQLVFFSIFAAGAALVMNKLLGSVGLSERWFVRAVLGTPFTLMGGAVLGLRMALLLPTNLRAGWIFRLTERADSRALQLNAVRRTILVMGVVLPVTLAAPIFFVLLGWTASLALLPLTLLIGWMFTEIASLGWRRIPFTCTFLFAKRPPAYTFGLLVAIFGWFVFVSANLLEAARSGLVAWLVVAGSVGAVGAGFRWYRLQTWGRLPLEFEDYLPDGLETLKLGD